MGYSFALAVTVPAYLVAGLGLLLGASWIMAFAILMGATALGALILAATLLSDRTRHVSRDTAEQDSHAPRTI